MSKNTQLTNAIVNAQADYLARQLDTGYLRIYTGTQPATANTALSGNTLLAELRFQNPSAPAASLGVLTFAVDPNLAGASGTPTFYRCLKNDGSTVVMDGNVGVTGDSPNLVLSTTTISAGGTVTVTSFTHSVAKSYTGL